MQVSNDKINSFNGFIYEIGIINGFLNTLNTFINMKNNEKNTNSKNRNEKEKLELEIRKYNRNKIKIIKNELELFEKKIEERINIKYLNQNINNFEDKLYYFYLTYLEKIIDNFFEVDNQILRKNIKYIYIKGFLNGSSLLFNYLNNINRIIKRKDKNTNKTIYKSIFKYKIETIHFNINEIINIFDLEISNNNNLNHRDLMFNNFNLNFDFDFDIFLKRYSKIGCFLNTDFLLHLKNKQQDFIFIPEISFYNYENINIFNEYLNIVPESKSENFSHIKGVMEIEYSKLLNKTFIENLNIEEGDLNNLEILKSGLFNKNNSMIKLLTTDKELLKLIQSISYMFTYLKYLNDDDFSFSKKTSISMFGMTSLDINSFHLNNKNLNIQNNIVEILLELLEEVHYLYVSVSKNKIDNKELENLLIEVFKKMQLNDLLNTEIPSNFEHIISKFIEGEEDFNNIEVQDYIDIKNTTTLKLRQEHTKLFINNMKEKDFLFAIGSPGIGKTTSVIGYLTELDNYIFMYTTSRTAVNEDIISKINEDSRNIFSIKENQDFYNLNEFNIEEFENSNICFTTNSKLTILNTIKTNNPDINEILNNIGNKNYILNENELEVELSNNSKVDNISIKKSNVIHREQQMSSVFENISFAIMDILKYTDMKKITTTFAIQGYRDKKNIEDLLKFIPILEENNIDNLVIMIDEITGSENSINFIDAILNQFYRLDENNKSIRKKEMKIDDNIYNIDRIKLKFIISDASISNIKVLEKFMNSLSDTEKLFIDIIKNNSDENIYNELIKNNIKEHFNKENTNIINVNSYPAKELKTNYLFYNTEVENNNIYKDVIDNIIEWMYYEKNNNRSLLVFLQNKNIINDLVKELQTNVKIKEWSVKNNFDPKFLFLKINNDVMKNKKIKDGILKEKDNYKFIFVTSTASRGLSFKKVNKLIIFVPTFHIEEQLNEIIQVIYRGRGNKEIDENETKVIDFILEFSFSKLDKNENYFYNILNRYLTIFNFLFIIKGIIETRINGGFYFRNRIFRIVPNGEKGIKNDIVRNKAELVTLFENLKDISKWEELTDNEKFLINIYEMINLNPIFQDKIISSLGKIFDSISDSKELKHLIGKKLKYNDTYLYERVKIDSSNIFIKNNKLSFNIYKSKNSNLVIVNEINKYSKIIKEKIKEDFHKNKLLDEVLNILKNTFFKIEEHTIVDEEFKNYNLLLPLIFPLIIEKDKFINKENKLYDFIEIYKLVSQEKYNINPNDTFPIIYQEDITYNYSKDTIPYIFFNENKFEEKYNKIIKTNSLSNNFILSSLNILNSLK